MGSAAGRILHRVAAGLLIYLLLVCVCDSWELRPLGGSPFLQPVL